MEDAVRLILATGEFLEYSLKIGCGEKMKIQKLFL